MSDQSQQRYLDFDDEYEKVKKTFDDYDRFCRENGTFSILAAQPRESPGESSGKRRADTTDPPPKLGKRQKSRPAGPASKERSPPAEPPGKGKAPVKNYPWLREYTPPGSSSQQGAETLSKANPPPLLARLECERKPNSPVRVAPPLLTNPTPSGAPRGTCRPWEL
ncbi:hypothetical protein MMC13_005188 [Lambiella insularis]|nr:hypothetical protein [Lambiella insularis]